MIWVVLALIGGCVATPLQQGNLKIVKYTANRDGLFPQNDGIPIAPQPIIYNPQQPYLIQEPAPLTYSSVGGSVLTERDQQRHINIDEEVEAREEGVDEETKPVDDPKVDSNVDSKDETVVRLDDQKPVQTETAALVGSNVLPVKGGVQTLFLDNDQLFPSVISGQRRLIEPQPQLYGVKGKLNPSLIPFSQQVVPQQRVIYSVQQSQQPVHVEEQRISNLGVQVRRPVVQFQQVNPVQKPFVPREWLRKPVQQGVGVKGHNVQQQQQQIQYFIQPVISSDLGLLSSGQLGQPVDQPQVLSVQNTFQGVKGVQQRGQSVQEDSKVDKVDVPKRQEVDNQVQPDNQQGVQDVVQGVQQQQQQRHDVLTQKQGVKSPVDHSVHKIVVQTSQQQVPVVGQHQVIGYQLVGQSQPQQILYQQPIQHIVSPISHQNVQYVPISDIQRYYQVIQSVPIQPIGQQIAYAIQSPQVIDQPIHYSSGQVSQSVLQSVPVGSVDQSVGVNPVSVGGLHGSQRISGFGVQQNQEERSGVKGQDLRVNPSIVDQRRQRSFIGVKGVSV